MAVKIKLKRLGKIRNPQYRIVVADARAKRDGRSIEEIGVYQPKQEPSLIQVDSERAQYWLGVGAQPTEAVAVLLKITGDWQKFKGLPGAEGTLRVAEAKPDKRAIFDDAAKAGAEESLRAATTPKKRLAPAEAATEPKADAAKADPKPAAAADDATAETAADAAATPVATEAPAVEATEAPAAGTPAAEAADSTEA